MSTNQKELLEKHEEWQDTIEVKPKIKINGTCIEKQEFTYPMWFRYKVFDLGYIVRFDSLTTGEVIPHKNWTLDCYICDNLTPHTNTTVWEQVVEPKETKESHNEHYKKQQIDTIARCKANMTLEQQKAICIFNCDRYLHREKGQNLSDIKKIRDYLDWLEDIENKIKEEK